MEIKVIISLNFLIFLFLQLTNYKRLVRNESISSCNIDFLNTINLQSRKIYLSAYIAFWYISIIVQAFEATLISVVNRSYNHSTRYTCGGRDREEELERRVGGPPQLSTRHGCQVHTPEPHCFAARGKLASYLTPCLNRGKNLRPAYPRAAPFRPPPPLPHLFRNARPSIVQLRAKLCLHIVPVSVKGSGPPRASGIKERHGGVRNFEEQPPPPFHGIKGFRLWWRRAV